MPIGTSDGQTYDSHFDQVAEQAQQHLQKKNVQDIISNTWSKAGATPNAIEGVKFNIGEESGFNPNLRHPDQPHFTGEAHYAHGLTQEGGEEWNRMQKFLGEKPWQDPQNQMDFAAWNLKTNYPSTWKKMNDAPDWQHAAEIYAREYLKPASEYLENRVNKIYGRSTIPTIHVTPANVPMEPYIDRDHDVPLAAGSLIDPGTGEHYGSAIDRHIAPRFNIQGLSIDPAQFVNVHEAAETNHIFNTGVSYQESHDKVATPAEEKAVKAFAKENGKEPESFWKEYQSNWNREYQKIKDYVPEKVHPHLYLQPYKDMEHPHYASMLGKVSDFVKDAIDKYKKMPSWVDQAKEMEKLDIHKPEDRAKLIKFASGMVPIRGMKGENIASQIVGRGQEALKNILDRNVGSDIEPSIDLTEQAAPLNRLYEAQASRDLRSPLSVSENQTIRRLYDDYLNKISEEVKPKFTGGGKEVSAKTLGTSFKLTKDFTGTFTDSDTGSEVEQSAFHIFNEKGEQVGDVTVLKRGHELEVAHLYSKSNQSWTMGTKGLRQVVSQLRKEYPDAKTLVASRISGARVGQASPDGINSIGNEHNMRIDLKTMKPYLRSKHGS
jgi:tail lysozyme